ncbi:MAG: pectate lyase [Phaeodactylibacter sp.]|nr:pectate lyase [Phaeodactylibacter sp.]
MRNLILTLCIGSLFGCDWNKPAYPTDPIAEQMLVYQRNNGGWTQYQGDPTHYEQPFGDSLRTAVLADKDSLDATIDDHSTSGEITYLLRAYQETGNPNYLQAAEKGIEYLLEAQYANGGWPQFYPRTTGYHAYITYNDNAMIEVLQIMQALKEGHGNVAPVRPELKTAAARAMKKGLDCILKTQVVEAGNPTVWCAQHQHETLLPAPGRTFEPPSLSGAESVNIVRFLMSLDSPSVAVKRAVQGAAAWFEEVKIEGWNYKSIADSTQPSGRDRIIYPDSSSTIWARFYELETFRPIFAGRDAVIHYELKEVENSRRIGYAYYGKWPQDLLDIEYPQWVSRHEQ